MAFYVVEHVNRKTHEIKAETFQTLTLLCVASGTRMT